MEQAIVQIPTEKLLPNPYQPRKQFNSEEMLSLADSIKENGVLQPLLCRQINNSDYYELVAGERRLRASILANLQTVPCVIIDCGYEESAVYSILENIQRSNLNFFEEAQAIGHLINHFGMTQEQIGKKLGKSQSALSNKLRLLRLPVDVRYFIEKEGLTERHARALLKIDNEKDMWTTLKVITDRHMNVEQTEAYIDSITDKKVKPKKTVIKIFKDIRIFVNTVDKAIATMKEAGIDAQSDKTETEEYIEYRVRIPKEAHPRCTNSA
ncbi:MAG: ParB/RepB/Spo0J family partition protein [Eubacteriales bacterium]|nr:ParB/RepB/Spo0J family partition protein [Eubacteriales bacterium]